MEWGGCEVGEENEVEREGGEVCVWFGGGEGCVCVVKWGGWGVLGGEGGGMGGCTLNGGGAELL